MSERAPSRQVMPDPLIIRPAVRNAVRHAPEHGIARSSLGNRSLY